MFGSRVGFSGTADVGKSQRTMAIAWFGPKVGGRLVLFCIHRLNRVNSLNDSVIHDDNTIKN